MMELKYVNPWVKAVHYKMKTLLKIIPLISEGDNIVMIDLMDTYFPISVASKDQLFLIFCVQGSNFQLQVLFFDLQSYHKLKTVATLVSLLYLQGWFTIT